METRILCKRCGEKITRDATWENWYYKSHGIISGTKNKEGTCGICGGEISPAIIEVKKEVSFQATIHDKSIWVWCCGKWRPIHYYQGKKVKIEDKKTLKEMMHTLRLNARIPDDVEIKFRW